MLQPTTSGGRSMDEGQKYNSGGSWKICDVACIFWGSAHWRIHDGITIFAVADTGHLATSLLAHRLLAIVLSDKITTRLCSLCSFLQLLQYYTCVFSSTFGKLAPYLSLVSCLSYSKVLFIQAGGMEARLQLASAFIFYVCHALLHRHLWLHFIHKILLWGLYKNYWSCWMLNIIHCKHISEQKKKIRLNKRSDALL